MIRKSGNRFSEKIMRKQKARAGRRSNHNSSRSSGRPRPLPPRCYRSAVPLPRFAGQDRETHPAGPSWQDCGPVGEFERQVGTSHFEQAASDRPRKSEEIIVTKSRTRRSRSRRTTVRIPTRLTSPNHLCPRHIIMARDCDRLAAFHTSVSECRLPPVG